MCIALRKETSLKKLLFFLKEDNPYTASLLQILVQFGEKVKSAGLEQGWEIGSSLWFGS